MCTSCPVQVLPVCWASESSTQTLSKWAVKHHVLLEMIVLQDTEPVIHLRNIVKRSSMTPVHATKAYKRNTRDVDALPERIAIWRGCVHVTPHMPNGS